MGKKIRITVLVENSVAFPFLPGNLPGMLGEHGLALLIDNGEEKVLYDTGRGYALKHNLDKSGYKPESIDKVIISHGHLDHTGSLFAFLEARGKTAIYGHPGIFDQKYGIKNGDMNYIGIPSNIKDLETVGGKFNFTTRIQELTPEIIISGQIPRVHSWELVGGNFFIKKGEKFVPDTFEDDQAVFISSRAGIIILTGCGHAGVINIIEHALDSFGPQKILAVIGGLHLSGASPERVGLTIKYLKEFDVEKLFLGHCTGFEAMCNMRQELGEKVVPLNVGKIIEF